MNKHSKELFKALCDCVHENSGLVKDPESLLATATVFYRHFFVCLVKRESRKKLLETIYPVLLETLNEDYNA